MDYTVKGMLVMLQDLQRAYFGKLTIYVDTLVFEDSDTMVNGCVFDNDGEPHSFLFYSYESDDRHKEKYQKLLDLIDKNNG